jgi:arylsulfatase A-like enzyme
MEKPGWLQGVSLMPLVRGACQEVREEIFAELNYPVCYEPQRAVRTRRWKYVLRCHDRGRPVLPDCDDSASKDFLIDRGWQEQESAAERLYDLVYDPHETCNLAGDPRHGQVLAQMRARLERWRRETGDPLLEGRWMVPPETAGVADPDELSPREAPAHPARRFLGIE